MYRHHYRCTVLYGRFRHFVEISREISELERARGWAVSTIWTPTVGMHNEAIVIAEYQRLDDFERERDERHSDAEYMALARKAEELIAPGTFRDELLEEPFGPA